MPHQFIAVTNDHLELLQTGRLLLLFTWQVGGWRLEHAISIKNVPLSVM